MEGKQLLPLLQYLAFLGLDHWLECYPSL